MRIAYFTDILQYIHGQLEVTNMECWESQSDMTKMAIAVLKSLPTGFADARLAGDSLNNIHV